MTTIGLVDIHRLLNLLMYIKTLRYNKSVIVDKMSVYVV